MSKPKYIPTDEEIEENLKLFEKGRPLTIPLRDLGEKFKTKFKKRFGAINISHPDRIKIWRVLNEDKIRRYNFTYSKKYYKKNRKKILKHQRAYRKKFLKSKELKGGKELRGK